MSVARAEIEINATSEQVWSVLADLQLYSEWNPFTPRAESTLCVGDPIHLDVRLKGERTSQRVEWVTRFEPGQRMCWEMKIVARFLLHAERCQSVTPLENGRSRYVSEDHFTGWLAPLVMRFFGADVERGFADCAEALKQRVEGVPSRVAADRGERA